MGKKHTDSKKYLERKFKESNKRKKLVKLDSMKSLPLQVVEDDDLVEKEQTDTYYKEILNMSQEELEDLISDDDKKWTYRSARANILATLYPYYEEKDKFIPIMNELIDQFLAPREFALKTRELKNLCKKKLIKQNQTGYRLTKKGYKYVSKSIELPSQEEINELSKKRLQAFRRKSSVFQN